MSTENRFEKLADEWAEEAGVRVSVYYDREKRMKVISIAHTDGENLASATLPYFRLERIIAALQLMSEVTKP